MIRGCCLSVLLPGVLAAAGCSSTSPAGPFRDVSHEVEIRSGQRLAWDRDTKEDRQATAAIDRLLARDLDVDGAVQIALLASPLIRKELEELAIGQADLVQAGLLANPVFGVGRTAWEAEHIDPNLAFSVEEDFLSLVTLPMRKRVAAAELEAKKLEVGGEIMEHAAMVRSAFHSAQAAAQVLAMRRLVDEAAQTSAAIAKKQAAAGNMSDLALETELTLASETHLESARAEGEAVVARERVTKLMGLWGPRANWKPGPRLPELPRDEVSLEDLEQVAMKNRLDIAAGRQAREGLERALSLAKTTRWTGSIRVNVEAGRLRNTGDVSFGPTVFLEIPLFDQRQAQLARLEAFVRQSVDNLDGLGIDARSDVRSARARVVASRAVVVEYLTVLVPRRENIVQLSQRNYDAMLLGVYQLLSAKQAEYSTYRETIEALRDYWIARSDLERAVGTRLSVTPRGAPHANH